MDDDEHRRCARRAFIRAHHPDRGGDPAAFAAGLASLDRTPVPVPPGQVVMVAGTHWLLGLLRALAHRIGWRRPPSRVR